MNEVMCPVYDCDCPYLMMDGSCQLGQEAYSECDEMWPFLDEEDEFTFEIEDDILLIEISLEND